MGHVIFVKEHSFLMFSLKNQQLKMCNSLAHHMPACKAYTNASAVILAIVIVTHLTLLN